MTYYHLIEGFGPPLFPGRKTMIDYDARDANIAADERKTWAALIAEYDAPAERKACALAILPKIADKQMECCSDFIGLILTVILDGSKPEPGHLHLLKLSKI